MTARTLSGQAYEHRKLRDNAMRSARRCSVLGQHLLALSYVQLARAHSKTALLKLRAQRQVN